MLTQLNVSGGSSGLSLPLYESQPYEVKDISGLGPVPTSLTEITYSDQDGGEVRLANVASREIIISLHLNPNYAVGETAEDLRRALYGIFTGLSEITLSFVDDVVGSMSIKGWVQSITPSMFDPNLGVEIKITCPFAYFKSEQVTTIASPVLTGGNFTIEYEGNAPAGFQFDVMPVTTNMTEFSLKRVGQTYGFSYYQTVNAGNRFAVNTRPGEKAADLWVGAVKTNKLGGVSSFTAWDTLILLPGSNVFNFTWVGPAANPLKNVSWTNYYLSL